MGRGRYLDAHCYIFLAMSIAGSQVHDRTRTWPQRFLISINGLLLLGGLLGAGELGYFYLNLDQIGRLDDLVLRKDRLPDEPMNILLVGSDSRAFVDDQSEAESFGTTATGAPKSDTIMLVRIDAKASTATMLSFPRDLWVKVADLNQSNRINVAFNSASADPAAGAQRLIKTIDENFNVPIDHYVQIDFAGFKALVDAIGGVEFFFASQVRDWSANPADGGPARSMTGLNVRETGCVHLNGDQALGYVRSRNFQTLVEGRWEADRSGDLGRIERQQNFVSRVAKQALSKGLSDPRKLNRLVKVAANNVNVDKGLEFDDMVAIGKRFKSLSPDAVTRLNLSVRSTRKGGASVVEISDPLAAEAIFDVFRGVDPNAPKVYTPSDVRVRVLNGSGRKGEALNTSNALTPIGFSPVEAGNASATKLTTIRYGSGQRAKAELLDSYLATPAVLQEDLNLTVDAVLITGANFTGISPTPRASGAPPPTTAVPIQQPSVPPTTAPSAPTAPVGPATPTTTIPEC